MAPKLLHPAEGKDPGQTWAQVHVQTQEHTPTSTLTLALLEPQQLTQARGRGWGSGKWELGTKPRRPEETGTECRQVIYTEGLERYGWG